MIETVWREIDDSLAREIETFWAREAGFAGDAARARLPEVTCVVRHDGALVGVSSAFDAELPLLAGRRFAVFRCLLAGSCTPQDWRRLYAATYAALDSVHQPTAGAPEGLCALVGEEVRHADPAAECHDPRAIYAGYAADGRQLRVAYFSSERSASPTPDYDGIWLPGPGYGIEPFAPESGTTAYDVIELWVNEAGLAPEEAKRRASELVLVARDGDGAAVGAATAYLEHNDQLRTDMWYVRAFVSEAHRLSMVAVALACNARDVLIERFRSGADTRGLGIVFEVENPGLKRAFPRGRWWPTDFLFIGENRYGAHVRVHYFPGVTAPEP